MGIYSTITVSRNQSLDFISKHLANCNNEQLANILDVMLESKGCNCSVEDAEYCESDDYIKYLE